MKCNKLFTAVIFILLSSAAFAANVENASRISVPSGAFRNLRTLGAVTVSGSFIAGGMVFKPATVTTTTRVHAGTIDIAGNLIISASGTLTGKRLEVMNSSGLTLAWKATKSGSHETEFFNHPYPNSILKFSTTDKFRISASYFPNPGAAMVWIAVNKDPVTLAPQYVLAKSEGTSIVIPGLEEKDDGEIGKT